MLDAKRLSPSNNARGGNIKDVIRRVLAAIPGPKAIKVAAQPATASGRRKRGGMTPAFGGKRGKKGGLSPAYGGKRGKGGRMSAPFGGKRSKMMGGSMITPGPLA